MYGTPLGHTPAPCHGLPTRLPPHNPRLHAPPKHGHVNKNFCVRTILVQPAGTWELTWELTDNGMCVCLAEDRTYHR